MADPPAFERDPYLARLAAAVISVGEAEGRPFALVDDTIFYPAGGGQPADRGRLNGVEVLDVQRSGDGIRHFLETPVPAGPADLELDWDRRYDHMQQHTAQHLLSAIAAARFGWVTTSFHLGALRCDIEIDSPAVELDALAELEELVARAVRAARPVTARRVSPEEYAALGVRTRGLPEDHRGEVRLVEIEGVDLTTCGGTHLRSTAEIEAVKLGPTESMRGGTRLHWLAGGRVRRRLAALEERNRDLRLLFETAGDELVATAAARLEAARDAARAYRHATAELAEARASALAARPEAFVEAHFEGVEPGFLQRLGRELVAGAPGKAVLLTATSDKGSFFVLAAGGGSRLDVSEAGPRVAALLDGRGGGSGSIYQGKAGSLDRRAEAVAEIKGQAPNSK